MEVGHCRESGSVLSSRFRVSEYVFFANSAYCHLNCTSPPFFFLWRILHIHQWRPRILSAPSLHELAPPPYSKQTEGNNCILHSNVFNLPYWIIKNSEAGFCLFTRCINKQCTHDVAGFLLTELPNEKHFSDVH